MIVRPGISTFTTSAVDSGATVAIPMPLLVSATISPVVIVPWPTSSLTACWPDPFWVPLQAVKRAPAVSLPARSRWPKSVPVSTSAISTPRPIDTCHACGARMLAGHPVRPH